MGTWAERRDLGRLLAACALRVGASRVRLLGMGPTRPWDGRSPLRIVFLSPYPTDHYGTVSRIARWKPHLEARGCVVAVLALDAPPGPGTDAATASHHKDQFAARAHLIPSLRQFHVVVLHRAVLPAFPWLRPTLEGLLRRVCPRIVLDYYDAIPVLRQERNAESRSAIARWLSPVDAVQRTCRMARVVTVSYGALARVPREAGADVRVVPMMVNPGDYRVREHRQGAPIVLGWTGTPGNLDLPECLAPALRRVVARRRIILRIVSTGKPRIEGVPVDWVPRPWSPATEAADFDSFDVGLLPMRDDPLDHGKVPLKLVQYAAAGLPVVASPTVEGSAFVEGRSILHASNGDSWTAAIERLVDDVSLRAHLGRGAREVVERHYDFRGHADGYVEMLREVASRPGP